MKRALILFGLLLQSCSRSSDPYAAETAEREAYARRTLIEDDAGRAYGVSSHADVQFEEGFSILSFDPPDDFQNHAFRWMGQNAHVRLKTYGDKPMKLVVAGWAHEKIIRSKPVVTLYIDGQMIATSPAIEDGHYRFDIVVPPSALRRPWVDLAIRTSAVAFHWSEPPSLRVLVLYQFNWGVAD